MKVVIVHQNDLSDCGCACLSSIIKYYNGFVPIEKIRLDSYTDTGGTSAYNLIEASKKYGFDAVGKRISIEKLNEEIMPLIAHVTLPNGLNHYIVIYKMINNKIIAMDPAKGKVVMKYDDFLNIWSNVVIIFHPKNSIIKYNNNGSIFKMFFKHLLENKRKFIYFVLVNTLITILTIIGGFYFSISLQYINSRFLKYVIITFAFIALFKVSFEYLKGKLQNIINYLLDTSILDEFTTHLFNLPLNFMHNRTSGEVVSRVSELNYVKQFFSEMLVTLFWDSIIAFCSLIIIFFINFKLGLINIIFAMLYYFVTKLNGKKVYYGVKELLENDAEYNDLLIENIKMFESILNIDGQKFVLKKLKNKLNYLSNKNLVFNNKQNIINVLKNAMFEISSFMSITLGLILFFNNKIELNLLVLFEGFLNFFWVYFQNVINMFPKYYYLKASFDKLADFYNIINDEKEVSSNIFCNGDISFKNVSINYGGKKNIVNNFNCTIKKNSLFLFAGSTGVGKSSILKCLCGNCEYDGSILISGINIDDYQKSLLRKHILYVGQNENLFSGTIYENIAFGRKVSISQLYNVSNICLVDEIINKKPFRYNTSFDNSISNFSGGEKQRIILARALLSKFDILILDEALSEVDLSSELKIINNIKHYFHNKTIIYVSHKNVSSCFKNIICLNTTKRRNVQ